MRARWIARVRVQRLPNSGIRSSGARWCRLRAGVHPRAADAALAHVALHGILPPGTGVRDNVSPPLENQFTTLAEVLRDEGLKTAAFVGSSVLAPGRGLAQGFDSYREAGLKCSGAAPRRRASVVVDEALGWFASLDRAPFRLDSFVRHALAVRSAGGVQNGTSTRTWRPLRPRTNRSAGCSRTSKPTIF